MSGPYDTPPPWGYGGPGWPPPPPRHPQARTSMALGLVALLGALPLCGLPLFVAPFAWATGHQALRDIRASGGRLSGEGDARAGMVMGIIGTALLVLVLALVVLVVLLIDVPSGGWEPGWVPEPEGTSV